MGYQIKAISERCRWKSILDQYLTMDYIKKHIWFRHFLYSDFTSVLHYQIVVKYFTLGKVAII